MAERTEILNIQVNYEDAVNKIARFTDEINRAREDQKLLKKELAQEIITPKEYITSMEQNIAVIKVNQDSIRSLRKEIQNNIKIENEQAGSLKSLRAQLSNTTKAYDEMSKAERTGAKGKELLKHLTTLQAELGEAEEASGRFQRNVGNYRSVLANAAAGGNSFVASILRTALAAGSADKAFSKLGTQVGAFGKILLSLLANPIVLTIAAITGAIVLLSKAFKTNEENTNKLSLVMSKISSVFSYLLKVLEPVASFLVDVLIKAFEQLAAVSEFALGLLTSALDAIGWDSAAKAVADFTVELKENAKTAEELAKTQQILIKLNREQVTSNEEIEAQLKNVAAAMDKEGISISEKIKLLKQEGELNKAKARMQLQIALATKQAAELEIQLHGRTKEALDALAAATAGVTRATATLAEAYRTENANIAAVNKEAAESASAFAKKREALQKELEDSINKIIEDGWERQREIAQTAYDRKIADLEKRKKEEPKLEAEINKLIENETTLFNQQMRKLNTEEAKKIEDAERKKLDDAVKRQIEAGKAEQEAAKIAMEQRQLQLKNDIREAELAGQQSFYIRIAAKQAEIDALQQLENESSEMFLERQRRLNIDLNELQKEQTEYSAQQIETRIVATAKMFGALSELASEFADQSAALSVFAKATALFEIAMNQGKAIAAGIASAMSVPFPGNIAAIATTIAAIVSGITSALKVVKGAETPTATSATSARQGQISYFSEGGLVTGDGTGTSDSIPAMLSNGESVMTAATTSLFPSLLSSLNKLGGGVPITTGVGLGDMAIQGMQTKQAINEVISKMPNPIVQVKDITRGITKVSVRDTQRTV